MGIKQNISKITGRIDKVKKESGIDNNIILMAATKTRTVSEIQKAIDTGIEYIGENRIQEAMDKFHQLNREVQKHFIGHLQKNKVKYAVRLFDCIQSVENKELIDEIEKRTEDIIDIFIEVNITGQKSKFGISKNELDDFIKYIGQKKNIHLTGLMTMFPYGEDEKILQEYSQNMNKLFEYSKKYNKLKNVDIEYLSMGMSNDYLIAIKNGSNMVRLGSAIFGERSY
ncbi:MAG TPA: YggS family pyridoxal phosphate-dependent enzyme [Candidatus Mcinerneyibacterium sp.]|nr:YggS family pyridoxal phosphate-dependent enzyme [Candidatus Mcinerneyibacterium sp.]